MSDNNQAPKKKSDTEGIKQAIAKANAFIETHGLKKILIIIGVVFLGINTCSATRSVSGYDCSENAEAVVKNVLACEQQILDASIRKEEIKLERFKEEKRSEMEQLVAYIKALDFSKDGAEQLLKQTKMKTLTSIEALRRVNDTCVDKVQASMCRFVKR